MQPGCILLDSPEVLQCVPVAGTCSEEALGDSTCHSAELFLGCQRPPTSVLSSWLTWIPLFLCRVVVPTAETVQPNNFESVVRHLPFSLSSFGTRFTLTATACVSVAWKRNFNLMWSLLDLRTLNLHVNLPFVRLCWRVHSASGPCSTSCRPLPSFDFLLVIALVWCCSQMTPGMLPVIMRTFPGAISCVWMGSWLVGRGTCFSRVKSTSTLEDKSLQKNI